MARIKRTCSWCSRLNLASLILVPLLVRRARCNVHSLLAATSLSSPFDLSKEEEECSLPLDRDAIPDATPHQQPNAIHIELFGLLCPAILPHIVGWSRGSHLYCGVHISLSPDMPLPSFFGGGHQGRDQHVAMRLGNFFLSRTPSPAWKTSCTDSEMLFDTCIDLRASSKDCN